MNWLAGMQQNKQGGTAFYTSHAVQQADAVLHVFFIL